MSKFRSVSNLFGLDLETTFTVMAGIPGYLRDYVKFKRSLRETGERSKVSRLYPALLDKRASAGKASGHYFHQDIHVARLVLKHNPRRHIDVASRVDGFVSHVAVFREIEVVDIRPLETSEKKIKFVQFDIMNPQGSQLVADSVSCLHAIEHFGLGRYGDTVRADGYKLGINSLASMVEVGGRLYISVPIGPQRVEFNAHRVFQANEIPKFLAGLFALESFAYVDDLGVLHEVSTFDAGQAERSFGCNFGCGIYEFRRIKN
ncbi:DUF268 domain-containing protein [Mesorhizobium sp. M0323]|uniref:DUF268 domain-containing protein n=1 Tax=Mesorhizobium sp. M0323 TaxID=2956938 RepID=UPI003336260D